MSDAVDQQPDAEAQIREFEEILARMRPPPNHTPASEALERWLASLLKEREGINAAHKAADPEWSGHLRLQRTFMDWEVEGLLRALRALEGDREAQAAIAGIVRFTVSKNACAGW